jgi:Flp pilus assembly protein TadG
MVRQLVSNQSGNAILEFAMVFPVFIALILGIVNLAVYLNNDIVASSAARDAGRVTIGTGSAGAGREAGLETLNIGGLGGDNADVQVDQPGSGVRQIGVKVTYYTPTFAPGFAVFLGGKPWDTRVKMEKSTTYSVDKYLQLPQYYEPKRSY